MMTATDTCTTVAVVARPSPSVPPVIASPLWAPISVTITPKKKLLPTPGHEVADNHPVENRVPVEIDVDPPLEHRDQHATDERDEVRQRGEEREDEEGRQDAGTIRRFT